MLYHVLIYDLDLVFFACLGLLAAWYADCVALQHLTHRRPRKRIWGSALVLVTIGVVGAYEVGEIQRERLRVSIQGVAPTYADAIRLMGHEKIGVNTPPDDPVYLSMIERQKTWLKSYPAITDIYTMRRLGPTKLVILVDSETDYDHDGQFTLDTEQRTTIGEPYPEANPPMLRAFEGESVFDDIPVTDRWGTTVSAYAPMKTDDGKIDGIVGIDFAATDWIRTLLLGRGCVLGAVMTFLSGLLVLLSVSHLQRAEIELQRRFAESMHAKNLIVEEALHQLNCYQVVIDTHAMVCVTDELGTIVRSNEKFAALMGCTPEELVGRGYAPPDHRTFTKSFWEELKGKLGTGGVWHGEVTRRDRHGAVRWVDTTILPYRDLREHVLRHISVGTDITAKKRYETELVNAARRDQLTGLPNRFLFTARLDHAIRRAERDETFRFAVMFLDFDRFKHVNDTLGHDVGDLLLQSIASRLKLETGASESVDMDEEGNSVGRFGGDEFVVLVAPVNDDDEVLDLAQRLVDAFDETFQLGPHSVRSTVSIGIVFSHDRYRTAEELMHDSDVAMYEAKTMGKARYVVFDASVAYAGRDLAS